MENVNQTTELQETTVDTRAEELAQMSPEEFNAHIDNLRKEQDEIKRQHDEDMRILQETNERLQREQEALQRDQAKHNIVNELNKRDLGAFVEVFDIVFDNLKDKESLTKKVDALEQAVNNILVSKSFVPKETAQQDAYNQAIASGNVNQALTHKLGKLFGIK